MNFTPLGQRVVIKQSKSDSQTKGGVLLPDTAQGRQPHGVVVAVGPGIRDTQGNLIPMSVKVGDSVMFGHSAKGTEAKIGDDKFMIMDETEILGIIA